jgi:hypothetical protein
LRGRLVGLTLPPTAPAPRIPLIPPVDEPPGASVSPGKIPVGISSSMLSSSLIVVRFGSGGGEDDPSWYNVT